MKRLKLAVFNTQPPHLYFGGVERRIIEVSKRLSKEVDTRIYCGTKKGFKATLHLKGAFLVPCKSTDLFFPLDNWVFNKSISGMYNTFKVDVYESHNVSGYGFQKVIKKRGVSKPFVQTIHGVLADEYMQSSRSGFSTLRTKLSNFILWRLSLIEKETARNATLVVTVSNYSAKKIVQLYGISEAKVRIASNGVDPNRFKPIEDNEPLKCDIGLNNTQCVLFVGRLIPRKGLNFLIEAARQVIKENKKVMFVIVGDGPLKNHLTSLSKKSHLSDNFVFLGDVSDEVLPIVYNCADIFTLPSIQEGQGIALLEAQATAKPVVAFNVGGIGEFVLNKRAGLLVRPDSNELANAICKLLSNRSLREKMGNFGREFVCNNFSWDICAQRMFRIYNEALTRKEDLEIC